MSVRYPYPILLAFLVLCFVVTVVTSSAQAQFTPFSVTNAQMFSQLISSSGALSVYDLEVTIQTNGIIRATGKRYDVGSTSVTPSPPAGVSVSNAVSPMSRLGLPGAPKTNYYSTQVYYNPDQDTDIVVTNRSVESSCYAALYLGDSMKAKGIITSVQSIQYYPDYSAGSFLLVALTNKSVEYQLPATYKGAFGSFTGSAD